MPNTEENIQENSIPELSFTVEPSQNVQTPVDKTLSIAEMAAEAKATGDAIATLESAISDLNTDMAEVSTRTAADIRMGASDTRTITEALTEMQTNFGLSVYPIGSVYFSVTGEAPQMDGTWVEIVIPMTWGDAKNGTRNYRQVRVGETTGTLKLWLRVA